MKRILFFLPLFMWAQSFQEIVHNIDKNGVLQAKQKEILAKKELLNVAKAKNYPSIDASLQAVYLNTQPTMQLHILAPGLPSKFVAATKREFFGEVKLTYPLFSGFAITAMVEKAKLDFLKTKLQTSDLKRNLLLKATSLYSKIYALKSAIKAAKEAKKALEFAHKKAKGFFDQGLLAPSDLKNIEAKLYEVNSKVDELQAQKKNLLDFLSYLVDTPITSISNLPEIHLNGPIDIKQREDILALKKALEMDEQDIRLAQSRFYPTIALVAALKRYGDTMAFSGDGYRNGDQSFVGVVVQKNLFSGFGDMAQKDAAKYKMMARMRYLNDYQQRVLIEVQNDQRLLKALQKKYLWAKKEKEAKESYYELVKGRFANQLVSADELSRSIASLEEARAKEAQVRASIFFQKAKILLQESLKHFLKGMQ